MSQVTLSIVIGTYNRLALLRQCLDALRKGLRVGHSIVVVDAGSTDGTLEYLEQQQEIQVVKDEQLIGQAKSLNRVFKTLKSQYVCWLSDDNVIQPGMLDLAVSVLEREKNIGMVSLKVKDITGANTHLPYIGGIWPSGVLTCNQGVLSTDLVQKLGGFDEEFRDYGIDGDLTTRVLLAGYKVVLTKHVAIHHLRDHENTSWIDTNGRMQRLEMARAIYIKKFEGLIKSKDGIQYDKEKRYKSFPMRTISEFYRFANKIGISLRKWIGLEERDWRNLFMVRFVSRFDFLINIGKPYYLVQKMPTALTVSLVSDEDS